MFVGALRRAGLTWNCLSCQPTAINSSWALGGRQRSGSEPVQTPTCRHRAATRQEASVRRSCLCCVDGNCLCCVDGGVSVAWTALVPDAWTGRMSVAWTGLASVAWTGLGSLSWAFVLATRLSQLGYGSLESGEYLASTWRVFQQPLACEGRWLAEGKPLGKPLGSVRPGGSDSKELTLGLEPTDCPGSAGLHPTRCWGPDSAWRASRAQELELGLRLAPQHATGHPRVGADSRWETHWEWRTRGKADD